MLLASHNQEFTQYWLYHFQFCQELPKYHIFESFWWWHLCYCLFPGMQLQPTWSEVHTSPMHLVSLLYIVIDFCSCGLHVATLLPIWSAYWCLQVRRVWLVQKEPFWWHTRGKITELSCLWLLKCCFVPLFVYLLKVPFWCFTTSYLLSLILCDVYKSWQCEGALTSGGRFITRRKIALTIWWAYNQEGL